MSNMQFALRTARKRQTAENTIQSWVDSSPQANKGMIEVPLVILLSPEAVHALSLSTYFIGYSMLYAHAIGRPSGRGEEKIQSKVKRSQSQIKMKRPQI